MDLSQEIFELDYENWKIKVSRHSIGSQVIFKIGFPDKRQPLIITRALRDNACKFWTSIPEGRQKEADEIGPLIAEYIRLHQAK
ncbi:MAG: hypothetical protein ABI185_11050 [Ginsengibacter sp.]